MRSIARLPGVHVDDSGASGGWWSPSPTREPAPTHEGTLVNEVSEARIALTEARRPDEETAETTACVGKSFQRRLRSEATTRKAFAAAAVEHAPSTDVK